jgi:hypothetical protein
MADGKQKGSSGTNLLTARTCNEPLRFSLTRPIAVSQNKTSAVLIDAGLHLSIENYWNVHLCAFNSNKIQQKFEFN